MKEVNDALSERRKQLEKKRRAAKKRRRAKFFKKLTALLLIVAVITVAVLCLTVFFPIKDIMVKGESNYATAEIIKASGIEKGKNLWLSGSGAEEDIPKKLPFIASAEVDRSFPDSVTITVKGATPVYCYQTEKGFLLCDEGQKVLQSLETAAEGVTAVTGAEVKNTSAGETLVFENVEKQELLKRIIDGVKQNNIKLNSVDITEKVSILLYVDDRFAVKLGSSAYLEQKLLHLAKMIESSEKGRPGSIDLSDYGPENHTGILTRE